MAPIRGNGGLNIRVYVRDPEKAHPCAESRVLAYFASKSVQGPWLSRVARIPKKLPTPFGVQFGAQSRIRGNETPGRMVTNFCTGVGVHDVITSAYRVSAWLGVKFWASPLTCIVALTTLSHYRASVWYNTSWCCQNLSSLLLKVFVVSADYFLASCSIHSELKREFS